MTKKDKINLDELFGETTNREFGNGFNMGAFGGTGFEAPYGFGGNFGTGRLPHYVTSPKSLDIINNYEDEITKADSETREDLIGIDIELGRLSAFRGYGANYSRLKVKEHVTNITKRYRKAVVALGVTTCTLATALVLTNMKRK